MGGTRRRDRATPNGAHAPILKKTEHYLQALVMTGAAGKNSSPWYKNVNPQGFNNILAETWEICARHLGDSKGIRNADIDEVLAAAATRKIGISLQILNPQGQTADHDLALQ